MHAKHDKKKYRICNCLLQDDAVTHTAAGVLKITLKGQFTLFLSHSHSEMFLNTTETQIATGW